MNTEEAADFRALILSIQRDILKLQCRFQAMDGIIIQASKEGLVSPELALLLLELDERAETAENEQLIELSKQGAEWKAYAAKLSDGAGEPPPMLSDGEAEPPK